MHMHAALQELDASATVLILFVQTGNLVPRDA
jgi:hypothetical protein